MNIIAQIKLQPTSNQADTLHRTLKTANAACNGISQIAWEQRVFGKYPLQHLIYHQTKAEYHLSAQMVIRCIAKVTDSYKLDRKTQRTYRPNGSIAYDDRILSFNLDKQTVSIWTINGRQTIPFVCGDRQRQLMQTEHGESDLVYRKGQFYLLVVCKVDEPIPDEFHQVLGVDLGITNLATDSDGETYTGAQLEHVRQRYQRRRERLQTVGTKSAKRRLKQLSGKQRRFQSDTNHRIAKQLVAKAKGTRRALAVEHLTHIRKRSEKTVRKSQRAKHSNWSFRQLRTFLHYKATLAGVSVVAVDPRFTSQACNLCGCVDAHNRRDQATFSCVGCGHTNLADLNAARNIRDRAAVIQPMASNQSV